MQNFEYQLKKIAERNVCHLIVMELILFHAELLSGHKFARPKCQLKLWH